MSAPGLQSREGFHCQGRSIPAYLKVLLCSWQNGADQIRLLSSSIDKRLTELQAELLKRTGDRADYEDVADEIYHLREDKQKLQPESAGWDALKKRIADMGDFLREQPTTLTEYDEPLVRRMIEKVTVYENKFTVNSSPA